MRRAHKRRIGAAKLALLCALLGASILCIAKIASTPSPPYVLDALLLAATLGLGVFGWSALVENSEAEKRRAAMLSTLAHDLRQPVHAILLYLDALERRVEREDARGVLTKARAATQMMADQLSALNLYNRLERGDIAPFKEPISAREVADFACADIDSEMRTLICPEPAPTLETDRTLAVRALRNLINNAFTHGGGMVALEINQERDATRFVVADSGDGVAGHDRARIFEPFIKLEAGGDGLGLGLVNAAMIAKLLGGSLMLDEADEGGARFVLRLPSRAKAAPSNGR